MDMSSLKRKGNSCSESGKRSRASSEVVDDGSIVVGSRKSNLAVIQTTTIMKKLEAKFPKEKFRMKTMETLGDKILNIALPKIGEKSLFTKDLEIALATKRVEFLVHSLKDLPTTLPPEMAIGTIIERDNPYDCVLFHPKHKGKTLADLPKDSVIGTSSLRRIAQLKRSYPHLRFQSVRGNLNTRLRKLENEDVYDALILAKAGVDRMQWTDKIGEILTEKNCLYAIGQGAIAVEIRRDDDQMKKMLGTLTDMETLLSCVCERAFMRKLNGGCSTPVGCISKIENGRLSIRGVVLSEDGATCLDATVETNIRTEITPQDNKTSPNMERDTETSPNMERDTKLSPNMEGNTTITPPCRSAVPLSSGTHETSYSVSESGIVIDSLYIDELKAAEELGEKLAGKLIELGADRVLANVRANIPKIMNIQIPTNSK